MKEETGWGASRNSLQSVTLLDALEAFQLGDINTAVEKVSLMEQASFKVVDILSALSHKIMDYNCK